MKSYADRYAGASCTLNGERAIIGGRREDFAKVMSLQSLASAEFSWSTVHRVMTERGGAFRFHTDLSQPYSEQKGEGY